MTPLKCCCQPVHHFISIDFNFVGINNTPDTSHSQAMPVSAHKATCKLFLVDKDSPALGWQHRLVWRSKYLSCLSLLLQVLPIYMISDMIYVLSDFLQFIICTTAYWAIERKTRSWQAMDAPVFARIDSHMWLTMKAYRYATSSGPNICDSMIQSESSLSQVTNATYWGSFHKYVRAHVGN